MHGLSILQDICMISRAETEVASYIYITSDTIDPQSLNNILKLITVNAVKNSYLASWFYALMGLKIIIWDGHCLSTLYLLHTRKHMLCIEGL